MSGINLSPKHGVNPAIPICYVCLKPKNEIILAGRLKDDAEAPHAAVWDYQPCATCEAFMTPGIILISVKPGESGNNPYRTGGWAVVKEEAVRRMLTHPPLVEDICKRRMAFMPDDVWNALGLPAIPGSAGGATA